MTENKIIKIDTKGFNDIINITDYALDFVSEFEEGLLNIFVQGSTVGITTIEYEEGVLQDLKDAINRIAHTGAVRTTKQAVSSGIALQTEFELLNARLSEKADNLQIAEEQIFRLYALFQNATFDGEINYPDSFNIRDYATDLIYYQQAKSLSIGSPTFMKEIDKEIARAVVDDNEKLNEIFDEIDSASEVGQFTQDEVQQEDQEVEQEQI